MKSKNILKHIALWGMLPLVWMSCTDWDDHYDADGQQITSNKTLWEEIEARPELSNFKECLESYGYKEKLNGSQMYTVFAPMGEINTANLSRSKVKSEVIENHIARFAHSANGATKDKSVIMLNNKTVNFTVSHEEDGYLFGGQKLVGEYNIRAKNGVLHIIEGQQPFFHNIWEYLTTDSRFDKVRNYLYSYNDTVLDENKSVKGEINDKGQQEYLDSVIYIDNWLLYSIGQLDDEDSTYTMIVPTNEAWDEAYGRIKDYYVYSRKEPKRDSLSEHYTNRAIVRDLIFSHTVQKSARDSLVSTSKGVFKNPFETILSDYVDSAKCSNGEVFVVNELKHKPWDSWHTRIKVEAENVNALVVDTIMEEHGLIYRRELASSDSMYTKISRGSFLEVVDKGTRSHPTLTFNVWDVLKGKYNVKVVFLPQEMASSRNKTLLPNKFKVKASYLKVSGGADGFWMTDFEDVGGAMENEPLELDTVTIGTIDTQSCSYATESPGLQISIACYGSKSSYKKKYSTTLLIDCIILEPVKE